LETTVNQLLKLELTIFLDEELHDRETFHSDNSSNDFYHRTLHTEHETLALHIPRNRNHEFDSRLPLFINNPIKL